jgi:hypothetical protein
MTTANGEAVEASGGADSQLEQVRAKRRAIERARADKTAREAAASALEEETRALEDEQAILDAETEHGADRKKIYVCRTAAGLVIVKRPHPLLFRKYMDGDEKGSQENEQLIRSCLVYPSVEKFDRMLDDQPALLIELANKVVWLAGFRAKEVSAK